MKTTRIALFFLISLFCVLSLDSLGINSKDTRMLTQPAISADHIAFIYAEDLWVANSDGSQPRRLTVDEGIESFPVFSPDGKLIAFSAEYDGNIDVYTVPVEGGIPTRLTWHPGFDGARGFTPDGKNVLFISQRSLFTNRYTQLFTVSLDGGLPTQMQIPNAFHASYSPDGESMAYTPISDAFGQWKNYRGGRISTIWLLSFSDYSVVEIPKPEGGCNDTYPVWIEDKVFFLSDRNGEFNLFSYDIASRDINQLTNYKDFPIISCSKGNGQIVFEQAAYLHKYDPANSSTEKLSVGIAADLLELRPRFVSGNKYIRHADISPTGVRAVFDFRGDIITIPADKGDPRNLTLSNNVHEKFPAWSPDGQSIAYFSDASGEYQINIKSQDGKGDVKSYKLSGTGFYAFLYWSPDSKNLCFVDNGRNLYLMEIENGNIKKIDSDELYGPSPFRDIFGDWSFDSRWFVYTKLTETNFQRVYLYSLDADESYTITDGLSDVTEPVFDVSGKYLYFFASTDAGPVVNWFDQSNADMNMTRSIYLLTLQKETISPFAKASDEEQIEESDEKDNGDDTEKEEDSKSLKVDLDGIQNRIVDIPLRAGRYSHLDTGKEGEVYYVNDPLANPGSSGLYKFDLKEKKENEIMPLNNYVISANREKILYTTKGTWGITDLGKKPAPGKGTLKTSAMQVKIDPVSEWPQIFDEAWRVNRDYFYDPGMHGVNWSEMKKKYAQFLPDLSCRNDLNRVIQWMCSEVGVGHHRVGGGEKLNTPNKVNGGLLGADFIFSNNRYKISKIFEGLNWNPKMRSPLTEPGVNVKEGDYLLAVNGINLSSSDNIFSFFENTSGKIVELTVASDPEGSNSRTVNVVPISNDYSLRNRDWVEGNMKQVHEATNGQVAYVYVPNTAVQGHQYFKRYFFPQANKKAIIIDERFNGGGSLADYYIDILQRPYQAHWNMRYGKDLKSPSASIQGPKVMIIDETAGSGGDMLPWMFRKFGVGKLVGKRTWGGLVGVLGFPELLDGGFVTAPNVAIWTEDGFIVENVGVAPDIKVEQWPSEVIKGKDPQLLKAIEIALEELKKNPQADVKRPPYPLKFRK